MTNDDTTYNGWTNRATWLVSLHLANDHGLYLRTKELIASAYRTFQPDPDGVLADYYADPDEGPGRVERAKRSAAAEVLRDFVEDLTYPEDGPTNPGALFAGDLVGTALADVNWTEVADGWIEDIEEDNA